MHAPRVLWLSVAAISVAVICLVLAASPDDSWNDAYLSAGGGPETKPSFVARRARRSWAEDTLDWQRGTEIPPNELTGTKVVPAESVMSPAITARSSQSGSAVAVGLGGETGFFWLTARHMVDRCTTIRIAANDRRGESYLLAGRFVLFHPTADLALIETAPIAENDFSLPIERGRAPASEATHVGFPGGRPAAIYSEYLGLTRVRWVDDSAPAEGYRVWAERMQVPENVGGLGGLSGGATLGRNGSVIGTVVGVSERRGRILSTHPSQVAALIENRTTTTSDADVGIRIDQKTFAAFARQLIERRRVALLNCELSSDAKK